MKCNIRIEFLKPIAADDCRVEGPLATGASKLHRGSKQDLLTNMHLFTGICQLGHCGMSAEFDGNLNAEMSFAYSFREFLKDYYNKRTITELRHIDVRQPTILLPAIENTYMKDQEKLDTRFIYMGKLEHKDDIWSVIESMAKDKTPEKYEPVDYIDLPLGVYADGAVWSNATEDLITREQAIGALFFQDAHLGPAFVFNNTNIFSRFQEMFDDPEAKIAASENKFGKVLKPWG